VKEFLPNPERRLPPPRRHWRAGLCALVALGIVLPFAPPLRSQAPDSDSAVSSSASQVAAITSFRIVQEKEGQAVEILSTKPVLPSIQAISNPDRLVIDLGNARLDTPQKRISVQADQIGALRADQFQQNPPVARIVVDLLEPRQYTWETAGNRLVVHLGRSKSQARNSPFEAPTVPSLMPAPPPVVAAVRAAGPLSLVGNDAGNGSSISAGPDTAVLTLSSGGEVHVCPGTTVSVTPSQNRHNLMFSMNTGAMEAHFALDASSDSVLTPDFRILLVGPGVFHFAFSDDAQGNTCVRALPGNTASAIVSELLGDRTYQVKATDQLVFRSGQLDRVDMAVPLECGCPPLRDPPPVATKNPPLESGSLSPLGAHPSADAETTSTAAASSAAMPGAAPPLDDTVAPSEIHVQIEAPFVYHAPPAAPAGEVRALPVDSRATTSPALSAPPPLPPPASEASGAGVSETATAAQKPPARGFFRRLGGFFASLFR
jgi:hypothetical protein